jgi:hypothetical protein
MALRASIMGVPRDRNDFIVGRDRQEAISSSHNRWISVSWSRPSTASLGNNTCNRSANHCFTIHLLS